jgi:hypothetical protein
MNAKNVFTISLLLFVAAGLVVLAVKSLRRNMQTDAAVAESQDNIPDVENGVMVYYLHGNTRCPTCRAIEAYAREAVESGFADQLKSGQIRWRALNYEASGNEHFATDYEVVAPNVVLVKFKDGKQVQWKGLPEVWEHVGDKAAFIEFVQRSINEFLQEKQEKGV